MVNDEPRILGGRYEVGELIGRGGMADVHIGRDTRLGRRVAVKILRSELARDRSFLMRFRREAQAAASLNHPNIVAVFDSGEESYTDGRSAPVSVPYIVMEYVQGHTLRDILADHGPLDPFEACRIMAEVLRALDYSHDNGIVHRDIKPANVMMGVNGEPKVMDFGIARAIADTAATMTNTSVVVGTAQYLSPEQAQGHEVDARSDLYSSGCLLYELVTGRPPFIGDSPVAIAYQHVGQPPQPPSLHQTGVPSSLDVVVLHSLGKEPESRYQTGGDFASDLDAVRSGAPTLAAREAVASGMLSSPRPESDAERTGATPFVPAAVAAPAVTEQVVEEPVEDEKKKWPVWATVAALLAVLGLVLAGLWNAGLLSNEPDPVAVPAVVQQTQADATKALQRAGFQVKTEKVKNAARAGIVVAQKPDAQTMQPPGSVVTLAVSSGPGTVTIPDLANYDQSLASERLKALGLTVGEIKTVDSMTVDQGKVVSSDPKSGSKVAAGSEVGLNISSGKVSVPDVRGMSENGAIEALGKVGLRAQVTRTPSERRAGSVIAQAYPAKTKVPVGDVVPITVAEEPPAPSTVTTTVTPTSPQTSTKSPTSGSPSDAPTTPDTDTPSTSPTPTPTSTTGG